MTFTVECAFRLTSSDIEFRLDDDPPEDEMCELRGSEPQLGLLLAQGLSKIVELEVAHWQVEGGNVIR